MLTATALALSLSIHPTRWDTETKLSETAYQTLHLVDLGQTLDIAANPDRYYERESAWAIGAHPSRGKVLAYFALTAYGHAWVTERLADNNAPRWMRRTWQAITVGDTAHCVSNNFSIGLKVTF